MTRGFLFGACFQRADARFDGPIITWGSRRGTQMFDSPAGQVDQCVIGNERGTVVGFEDERGTVEQEERLKGADGLDPRRGAERQPEKLLSAGQIAHAEQIRVDAVDGMRRFGEVHGPHGAGDLPVEHLKALMIAAAPHAAVATQQVG